MATVMVRRLVRAGLRKGPSDLLLLPDYLLDRWYNEDAIAYLHEMGRAKQGEALEIR